MEKLLNVSEVEKIYGGRGRITKALGGISFNIAQGELVRIMGPSGSGKTTLLNCISAIDTVTTGHIYIDGVDITNLKRNQTAQFRRERIGFVFQEFELIDTLTAYENIAVALAIGGRNYPELRTLVMQAADMVGIGDILQKYPQELSGGQKQRVAAARALAVQPSIVLADEPTGALDSHAAKMILESFSRINRRLGVTILMVTHDAYAASWCSRILFLRDGMIFSELNKGKNDRKTFFEHIMEVVSVLGGDSVCAG